MVHIAGEATSRDRRPEPVTLRVRPRPRPAADGWGPPAGRRDGLCRPALLVNGPW